MSVASTERLWFPFYVNDWLLHRDVQFMSMESRGIYLHLLCQQWKGGALPSDPEKLRVLADCTTEEWERSSPSVLAQFTPTEEGLVNRRLERERQHADGKISSAKKAAAARWAKQPQCDSNANAHADAMPTQSDGNASTAQQSTSKPSPAAIAVESEDRARIRSFLREDLFPFYLTHTGKNSKTYLLTDQRLANAGRRYVEMRHRICGGDDEDTKRGMRHALTRLFASDFHMGLDPKTGGKKYNDWNDHIFSSWERFEKWLNR